MSSRTLLLIIALITILTTGIATLIFNNTIQKSVPKSEIETAINQARYIYNEKKERGEDLSNGPCISNALMPNWVVDIVHSPRVSADDLPVNQCPAYLEGRADHFVELDTEGNLIRAR